jgi:hypothetical protein
MAVDKTAEREEKVRALQEKLTSGVEQLVTGADWKRVIEFAARFRSRSFSNTLLIALAHAEAFEKGLVPSPYPAYVAGYKQWQPVGPVGGRADPVETVHATRLVGLPYREGELFPQTSGDDRLVRSLLDSTSPCPRARRPGVGDRHQYAGGDRDGYLVRLQALPDRPGAEYCPDPPQPQHTGRPREPAGDPL